MINDAESGESSPGIGETPPPAFAEEYLGTPNLLKPGTTGESSAGVARIPSPLRSMQHQISAWDPWVVIVWVLPEYRHLVRSATPTVGLSDSDRLGLLCPQRRGLSGHQYYSCCSASIPWGCRGIIAWG